VATGYVLRSRGLRAVDDYEIPTAPGGGAYSSARDVARYIAALLGGGANDHGAVLTPETVASLFAPHFQPDARLPGMGLGFELDDQGGHRVAAKGGIVSGYLAAIALAPDDGIGVFVLTNTGGLSGRGAAEPLATALLRHALGLPAEAIRTDVSARPDVWGEIRGWYGMERGPLANLFDRLVFGAGAEVVVRHGQLWFRPLSAIPSVHRGFRLHPDDEDDPYVFRLDLAAMGMGTFRVAFSPHRVDGRTRHRLEAGFLSLQQRRDALNPRRYATGLVGAGAGAAIIRLTRRAVRRPRPPITRSQTSAGAVRPHGRGQRHPHA
jgi:hypothetical protein